MTDLVGQTLGKYRIEALLGSGTMGMVYRGTHLYLNRAAAIKIMTAAVASDATFQERFQQEVQSVAALTNANIIPIYDFGDQDNQFYLVMELATAGSLRTLLGQQPTGQPLPLALGLDLVRQAADGLAYAHEKGMVHRDIKPDNLLLNPALPTAGSAAYVVKVADFGLANLAQGGATLAATGFTVGTLAYLSPEQCQGAALDGRSDLYSLGVVLYEVVTGYLPFQTNSPVEAFKKHVNTPPPSPRKLRPEIDPALEAIILRCLAKKPEERYATAAELSAALQALGETAPATPAYAETVITSLPDLIPRGQMQVRFEQETVQLMPNRPLAVRASVWNPSGVPEQVTVTVEGVPSDWVQHLSESVVLSSNAQTTVQFLLSASQTATAGLGDYLLTLRVTSQTNPGASATGTTRVMLVSAGAPRVRLSPGLAFGRDEAAYRVLVQNMSGAPAEYALAGEDGRHALTFDFDQPVVRVGPSESATVPFRVRPELPWHGDRPAQRFVVHATSVATGEMQLASAHFVSRPVLPGVRSKLALGVLLVLAVLFSAGAIPGVRPPWITARAVTQPTTIPKGPSTTATWKTAPSLLAGRFATAVVEGPDGRIYAIGGNTGDYTASVEAYTPGASAWTSVASMRTPRTSLTAVVGPDGHIYAFDGLNHSGLLKTVESYSPSANAWQTVGNLGVARWRFAAALAPDGRMFVFGGELNSNNSYLNTVEYYMQVGPQNNHYGQVASMPEPRGGAVAVTGQDGRIYVVGGKNSGGVLDSVAVYSPKTNSWSTVAAMSTPRYRPAVVVAGNGQIYVFGGQNDSGYLKSAEVYTPSTNSWAQLPPMPTARFGMGAALSADGHIYVVGGQNGSSGQNATLATVEVYG